MASLCAFLFTIAATGSESAEERFLDGLRQRRLFKLAESYCRRELGASDVAPLRRAALTAELIRTHGQRALNESGGERNQQMALARSTAAEFLRQEMQNPRLVLVRAQEALAVLALGDLQRQEAEFGAAGADVDSARQTLREANKLLTSLDKDVLSLIQARQRKAAEKDELTPSELAALQNNLRLHLARTLLNQGLSYESASDDRISLLTQATQQLKQIYSQLAPGEALVSQVNLEEAKCLRLLDKCNEALEVLASIAKDGPSPDAPPQVLAEYARVYVAQGKLNDALALLEAASATAPEIDLARVEVFVALWKSAEKNGNNKNALAWQNQIESSLPRIEQSHGAYWRRRAELLFVRAASGGSSVSSLDLLSRTADDFYLRKKFDEAVAAYDRAREQATQTNRFDRFFELSYKAALVQQNQGQFKDAAARFHELAFDQEQHPKAAEAHLMAIWNTAQAARQEPDYLNRYARLLPEHLETWPTSTTIDQVLVWSGKLQESKSAWELAMKDYLRVNPASQVADQAIQSAADCAVRHLQSLPADGKQIGNTGPAIADELSDRIWTAPGKDAEWPPGRQAAAISLARIQVQFLNAAPQAEKSLGILLEEVDLSPERRADAQALRILALAAQPELRSQADQALEKLANESTTSLLDLAEGLSRVLQETPNEKRAPVASLQLAVIQRLQSKRQDLPVQQQQWLDAARAFALLAAGRIEEAQTEYRRLAKANPNDGGIQEGYAEALLNGKDQDSWRQALEQWKIVGQRTPPRTDRWFRAKYSLALTLFKLGDTRKAAQFIQFMLQTEPTLESTPYKARFAELLKQCQAGNP